MIAPILAVLISCAPRYDPQTDQQITTAQSKADKFFVGMIGNATRDQILRNAVAKSQDATQRKALQKSLDDVVAKETFLANLDAYGEIASDIDAAQLRMTATPDLSSNEVRTHFAKVQEILADTRDEHQKSDRPGRRFLEAQRNSLNIAFQPLIAYQVVLKSGDSKRIGK